MKSTVGVLLAITAVVCSCTPAQQQAAQGVARQLQIQGETAQEPRASAIFPADGSKHFELPIGPGREVTINGKKTWLVELRGWLSEVGGGCNIDDPDWHWLLEIDPEWADSVGMPIEKLLRPGNMLEMMTNPLVKDTRARLAVGTANVDIELNGWVPTQNPGQSPPATWQKFGQDCVLKGVPTDTAVWEYDPVRPLSWQNPLQKGDYVRMFGSLVTDEPHDGSGIFAQVLCRDFHFGPSCAIDNIQLNLAKKRWGGNRADTDPDNAARWTEMHPPDIIAVLPMKQHVSTLTAVAVSAENCVLGCEVSRLDVDIPAPPKPAGATTVTFTEQVLSSTNFSTIIEGHKNASGQFDGSTVTTTPTGIHVHVAVQGQSAFAAHGRFGAFYRVRWQ